MLRKENPERGRKHFFPALIQTKNPIVKKRKPRKGTETRRSSTCDSRIPLLRKENPERGRKLFPSCYPPRTLACVKKRKPRKGTETKDKEKQKERNR